MAVAAVQPVSVLGDVAANAVAHAEVVRDARSRLVVFPELSLTGYTLDVPPLSTADAALGPIVDACREADSVALAGAPVEDRDGRRYIATLAIDSDGVVVAYRKVWLGDAEARCYQPGRERGVWSVDGWRIGLGICKDTGVRAHIEDIASAGVDLYVAGVVHRPDEIEVQDARGARIARRAGAWVAFASFAGATGGGYDQTAGQSCIWSADGSVVARAGAAPGEVAAAVLD